MAGTDYSQYSGNLTDYSRFAGASSVQDAQEREMAGWERTLDLLSRTTYVSAGFMDRILDEDTRNVAEAWNFARGEFFTPEERLTYSDVLKNHAPEWSAEHPVANFIAGLGMDIALDPLTYVGPGLIKGAGQLTGGIFRGAVKSTKALNQIRKGTMFADVGDDAARGMALGVAEFSDEAGSFTRAGIEFQETRRAYTEIEAARKATEKAVGRQFDKRFGNLQKRQSKEIVAHETAAARRLRNAETSALQDIEQYGIADARRVRDIRAGYPTLPERSVQQAGVLGRDSRLPAGATPRKGPRTKKVGELRQAAEARKHFKVVPEQSINPKYGKGQGPGFMGEPGDITRLGPPLADDAGSQMALRSTEKLDATAVNKLGKPVKDPLRGRSGTPHSEEVISYLDEVKAPVRKQIQTELAEMNVRHQGQLAKLGKMRKAALNDGLDSKKLAGEMGRAASVKARVARRWQVPIDKRAADVLTNEGIRAALEVGPKLPLGRALKLEWNKLDKTLGVMSGLRRLEKTVSHSDSWFGRKWDSAKELLQRDYKLPDWLISHRNLLYGKMLRAVPRVQDELSEIFGTLSKADSERLGAKMYDVFWETEQVKKANNGLKAGEAAAIRAKHMSDLTESERVVMARVYQRFEDIGQLDREADLVSDLLENYVPGIYENLEKNFFGMSKKLRKNLANEFTPGESKVFRSLDELTAAGLKPVKDLQTIYTARVLAHEQGIAYATFNSTLEAMYPGLRMVKMAGPDDVLQYKTTIRRADIRKKYPGATMVTDGPSKGAWKAKDGTLLTPSDRTINEISYIGQGLYGPEGFAGANKIWRGYDKALSWFRAAATVLKPAFAAKQVMANTAQVYLEFGAKGMKIYDPRVMMDTAMIMSRNDAHFAMRDVYGVVIQGKQLTEEAFRMGMLTNTPMDVGLAKNWNPRNVREMKRLVNRERAIRQVSHNNKAAEGFTRTFLGALKYTDLPGHVEDWYRVSTFLNARRMGMPAEQAAKHTNNALFNYMHGLSEFEAKVARRIIPFYSYQRFAVPLIAKTFLQAPGRVANAAKVSDAFFNVWNKFDDGATLTSSEQHVLPGWLVDQPHSFYDFDDRMRATFTTFNSFTPLDLISTFQELFPGGEPKGTFDLDEGLGRAVEKGVLSQV
ncbi:MAG: hypothetical protein ACYSW8_27750, partial [Planctomycetota bacterium]